MKDTLGFVFAALAFVSVSACADPGLRRYEPPTPTPTPQPGQLELAWAERVCAFLPGFERAATAWDDAPDATPGLEALRDDLLFMATFELKQSISIASQYLGLLARASTSNAWYGYQGYKAPPDVAEYERTLFDLFLDFEPVLHRAEAEVRDAQSLADLEAVHASVMAAREQMTAVLRQTTANLGPDALRAIEATADCAYLRRS